MAVIGGTTTLERLEQWLVATIQDKETYAIELKGEIASLRTTLANLRTFKQHEKETKT
jgi:hypothetical protein